MQDNYIFVQLQIITGMKYKTKARQENGDSETTTTIFTIFMNDVREISQNFTTAARHRKSLALMIFLKQNKNKTL